MMELNDRELLIRVEQQMQDASKNQIQIMSDLKEIFHRIENDSKTVSLIKGDLKTFSETSSLKMAEIERRLSEFQEKLHEYRGEMRKGNEDRIKSYEELGKALIKEKEDRSGFQNEVNGSLKTIKWIFAILTTVATLINVAIAFFKITH